MTAPTPFLAPGPPGGPSAPGAIRLTREGLRLDISRTDADDAGLTAIRAFRARVLYAGGRRPGFRDAAGAYTDAQAQDLGSYQVSVFAGPAPDAPLVACARLSPPAVAGHFWAPREFGPEAYAELLHAHGTHPAAVWEPGRLAVDPAARGRGLGRFTVAVIVALARALEAPALLCLSGMDGGQHRLIESQGFRRCAGTERYSAEYDDRICALLLRLDTPSDGTGPADARIEELRRAIRTAFDAGSAASAGGAGPG
ncbi:hypothetical protein [Streptomyces sp. NPDC058953]|uniref:hypothetical protein n=1 Tax=unclassified Streptomyces TaxID=2593676 RepID=UPI0036B008CD